VDETSSMDDAQKRRYREIRSRQAVLLAKDQSYGLNASKEQLPRDEAEAWKAIRREFSELEAELQELRNLNPLLPERVVKQYGPA
jgi:hypothetical protein